MKHSHRWSSKLWGGSSSKERSSLNYYTQLPVCVLCCVLKSLHVEFQELYWRIFSSNITADPDLNVISCGGRQLYVEPWWWIEGATGACGTTALSIPQGITIWPKSISTIPPSYAWLTEVVLSHKRGNSISSSAPIDTGACCRRAITWEPTTFINTSSEGPDVLARRAMCDTHTGKAPFFHVRWRG